VRIDGYARKRLGRRITPLAQAVLDDKPLAHVFGQPLPQQACAGIESASDRKGANDADRTTRVGRRTSVAWHAVNARFDFAHAVNSACQLFRCPGKPPGLSNLQKRTDTETAIRTETRTLREAAGRLNPPVIDLDALAATSIPSVETISRFRRDMETLDAERGRELDRHAVATDAITAAESKLQELASGRPIPSPEIISAKRLQRDTYWIALRATLFGTSEALAGSQLVESVANFERNSSEADQLADSASSDAKRVAAHAVESRRLMEERGKKAAAPEKKRSGFADAADAADWHKKLKVHIFSPG
jgi:hypothetical protein